MLILVLGLVLILGLLGVVAWLWLERGRLKEQQEQERKRLKMQQMQLQKDLQAFENQQLEAIRKNQHDAKLLITNAQVLALRETERLKQEKQTFEAQQQETIRKNQTSIARDTERLRQDQQMFQTQQQEVIRKNQSEAQLLIGNAQSAVSQCKVEIERLKQVEMAYHNQISAYQEQYLVPVVGPLDGLASEAGHELVGQQLKEARKRLRGLLKTETAAINGQMGQRQMLLEMFNDKVAVIFANIKHDNYGVLHQQLQDAFAVVNHHAKSNQWQAVIATAYFTVRTDELRWAAALYELRQREKEQQRGLREQIREEERSRKEYELAIKEAEKEERVLHEALQKMQQQWEQANAEQKGLFEQQKRDLEQQLHAAESRNQRALSMAQQTKAGNVYVISNLGSFGNDVVKIGMTRRLDPLDRIRELGSASVPFLFDVHAMIYSDNAPELEKKLHQAFNHYRVNKVNERKEFFKLPLAEIKQTLQHLGMDVQFTLAAQAQEYRKTLHIESLSDVEQDQLLDQLMQAEIKNESVNFFI